MSQWAAGADPERANVARVYDFLLGGSHNFEADREMARRMTAAAPEAPMVARANRAFLRRAVRELGKAGIRQFLDIGAGIPTVGSTHEVAAPGARVVYVDLDPVAVAHAHVLLADDPNTAAIQGDLREPDLLLALAEATQLLDFGQPVAVLMLAVLPFVKDEERPAEAIGHLRESLTPGSHLVISHGASDAVAPDEVADLYAKRATATINLRSKKEVTAFLDGWEVLPPGVVWLPEWRPEDEVGDLAGARMYGAMARKQ
ncbi:SAM-dependent methyltransferase [Kutzneria buriramensis]|uniref:S-adenosyl methyltransferase n=1 Tax=Kutzneria buriramensis TaxID=1045776 RepID=A0A3E0HVD0_9PSEU|nr:SAM-dependent methyltransferase [Kutzneria buriramensis]REH50206.1 S-adenosyl methyltransferase [Kutzneria buriramensis]